MHKLLAIDILSPDAKAYLDHLWPNEKLTLADIRRKMEQRFGVKFTVEELRAAARKPVHVAPALVVVFQPPKPAVHKPVIVREKPCVHRVAKGTFPARGFSMLGGRVR